MNPDEPPESALDAMFLIVQRLFLFTVGVTLPLQTFTVLNVAGFRMTPFKLAAAGLFAAGAIFFVGGRRRKPDATLPWLAAFGVAYAIGTVHGALRGVPIVPLFFEATTYSLLILYYLLIGFVIRTRDDLMAILWGLLVGGVATAFPAVSGLQGPEKADRYYGLSGQPNVLGIDMVVVIGVAIPLFLAARSTFRRALIAGALACLVGGLLLSLSRTAFLAGLAMWGLWVYRSRRLDTIQYVVPAAALLGVVLLLAPDTVTDRFSTIVDPQKREQDGSIQSRLRQYELGAKAFVSNPLLGIGVLNYVSWARQQKEGRGVEVVIHNAYMRIAVGQGLVGLIPYTMLLLFSWRHYTSAYRMARARRSLKDPWLSELGRFAMFLQLSLFGTMVAGMTAHTQKSKTAWLMLALSAVIYTMVKERCAELEGGRVATESPASEPLGALPAGSSPLPR